MNRFRNWLQRFMQGRYGTDEFQKFLIVLVFVLIVIDIFARNPVLSWITLALIIYYDYRMLSRNYSARYAERDRYLSVRNRITGFFRNGSKAARDRDHRYFRCPRCHQMVRVPKGKGRISIHCPKCGTDFIRRT